MEKLTTITHSLFCTQAHCYEVEKLKEAQAAGDKCLFYLEDIFAESWQMKDHKLWLEKTKSLMQDLGTQDPHEAFMLLTKLIAALKPLGELVNLHPGLRTTAIVLLEAI